MLQRTWESRFLFELVLWFSLDKYPEVELWDHPVVVFLIFWRTFILFPTVADPIYFPNSSAQGFPLPHSLACRFSSFFVSLLHFVFLAFLYFYIFASSASSLCVSSSISTSSVLMVPWSCFLEVKPSGSFWRHQPNVLYNFLSSSFLPSSLPSSFSLLLLKAIFRYMLFCIFREHYLFHMFQDVLWITFCGFHLFFCFHTLQ